MQELVINGKKYVKATDIAKDLGYTSDYVGQLCRSGKVTAEQVGRSWYVVPETIHAHKKTRYRSNQAKSKAAVAEYKQAVQTQTHSSAAKTVTHLAVHHYETDDAELIPTVQSATRGVATPSRSVEQTEPPRKVTITSASQQRQYVPSDKPKVQFTGSVSVQAVESEPSASSSITSKTTEAEAPKKKTAAQSFTERAALQSEQTRSDVPTPPQAAAKRRNQVAVRSDDQSPQAIQLRGAKTPTARPRRTVWVLMYVTVGAFFLAIAATIGLGLETSMVYSDAAVSQSISFDVRQITEFINLYIDISP